MKIKTQNSKLKTQNYEIQKKKCKTIKLINIME